MLLQYSRSLKVVYPKWFQNEQKQTTKAEQPQLRQVEVRGHSAQYNAGLCGQNNDMIQGMVFTRCHWQ